MNSTEQVDLFTDLGVHECNALLDKLIQAGSHAALNQIIHRST